MSIMTSAAPSPSTSAWVAKVVDIDASFIVARRRRLRLGDDAPVLRLRHRVGLRAAPVDAEVQRPGGGVEHARSKG